MVFIFRLYSFSRKTRKNTKKKTALGVSLETAATLTVLAMSRRGIILFCLLRPGAPSTAPSRLRSFVMGGE